MKPFLKEGERLDDLLLDGLKIIQNPKWYCFTSDAVELANFVKSANRKKVLDIGTGSGIIALLVAYKLKAKEVVGIDIQQKMIDMATRSAEMNCQNNVRFVECDAKEIRNIFPCENFDIVICNPPYRKCNTGDMQTETEIMMSRHEISMTLDDMSECAFKMLKTKGSLYIVHRFDRLAEIFSSLINHRLEPKELKFLYGKDNNPVTVLIKAVKDGKTGLKFII